MRRMKFGWTGRIFGSWAFQNGGLALHLFGQMTLGLLGLDHFTLDRFLFLQELAHFLFTVADLGLNLLLVLHHLLEARLFGRKLFMKLVLLL